MITFVTDVREGEPDILSSIKHGQLIIKDLEGNITTALSAPESGWTHERLCKLAEDFHDIGLTKDGVDAYIADQWVGSTEV